MDKNKFKLTPTRVLVGVVLALLVIFFVYLWFQYRFLVGSPFLEIKEPPDQFSTNTDEILISGRTDPEALLSINNQKIHVDQNGNFSQQIKLVDNVNNIVIMATSNSGKQTKIQRTVFLKGL